MNGSKNENIKQRKIYDINELLQSDNEELIKLYLGIKNATEYAYENCEIKIPLNYDIFNEIEKNAIKLEKRKSEEKFKYYNDIISSIEKTEKKPSLYYIKENYQAIKKEKMINNLLDKLNENEEKK